LTHATCTDINGNEYTVGSYGYATIIVGAGTCPTPVPTPVGGLVDVTTSRSGGSGATALLVGLLLAVAATGAAVFGFRRASIRR
jgi:hypothetical protein